MDKTLEWGERIPIGLFYRNPHPPPRRAGPRSSVGCVGPSIAGHDQGATAEMYWGVHV